MADDQEQQVAKAPTPEVPDGRSPLQPTGLRLGIAETQAGGRAAATEVLRQASDVSGLKRGRLVLATLNQSGGCLGPGNGAAHSSKQRSSREYGENDARSAIFAASKSEANADLFASYGVDEMRTWSDLRLSRSGRLTCPLLLEEGARHYRPVSWSRVARIVGESLKHLKGPDEAVFYSSGQSSNEAAFMWQLFARRFGTNNLPSAGDFCEASTDQGMTRVLGSADPTLGHKDLEKAECFIVLGHNPGSNQNELLRTLAAAKKRGAHIVAINPLPEAGLTGFADPWAATTWLGLNSGERLVDVVLPVRVNRDLALLKGLMKVQFAEEEQHPGRVLDYWFIESQTEGFAAWRADLESTSWETIQNDSGCSRPQIEAAGRLIAHAKGVVAIWGKGLNQHDQATEKVEAICNLMMLGGNLNRSGSGLWPVRGQVNIQGSKRMGCRSQAEKGFRRALGKEFGFTLPRKKGVDVTSAVDAMQRGKAKVLLSLGGNLLSASADTDRVAAAISQCDLTIFIATQLNRSHLVPGQRSLILPCLARTDRDHSGIHEKRQPTTCEDSLGMVQPSFGSLPPLTERMRSEASIIASLALETFGLEANWGWEEWAADYRSLRARISKVVSTYSDYELRIQDNGGFSTTAASATGFGTKSGKAQFLVHESSVVPKKRGSFDLASLRSHDQFNSQIFGLDDRPRGIFNERRILMMNRGEMRELGFQAGEALELCTIHDGVERRVSRFHCVPSDIPRGGVAAYFPEVNPLFPSFQSEGGHTVVVHVTSSPWS